MDPGVGPYFPMVAMPSDLPHGIGTEPGLTTVAS